jgi:hypothetical protein
MSGLMGKTLSRPLGAAGDQLSVTSTQKISFTQALERRAAETATMMQTQRIW